MTSTQVTSMLPVSNSILTLDADTVPGPVFVDLLERLTNGAPITVRSAVRNVESDTVRVTGKASLLGVPEMNVTALAVTGPEGPIVTVRFDLPTGLSGSNAWTFGQSFPDLPPFYVGDDGVWEADSTRSRSSQNLLNRIVLSDAAYVITTAESLVDETTGARIRAGLNFVARCDPTGMIGLLGSVLTGGGSVALGGPVVVPKAAEHTLAFRPVPDLRYPWDLPELVPGIHLHADLGIDLALGEALRFHDVGLRIYSPTSSDWLEANPSYGPVVAAVGTLDIPSAEVSSRLPRRIPQRRMPSHCSATSKV